MDFLNHPGNLGSVRGSIHTIHHYDWPAYPEGEDFRETLFQLTAFSHGTEFVEVDDGDHSILFVADVAGSRLDDPYHPRNIHVCSWHADLIKMHDLGFIRGVLPVTENAHVCDRWENILRVHNVEKIFVEIDGEMQEVTAPMREADDEEEPRNWVLLPNKRVSVTHEGLEFIVNEIRGANPDFGATLSPSVVTLMNNRLYDTAVREGCVILEHSIKAKLGSNKWGDRLTDEFFEYLKDEKNVLESWLRTYSQELRTIFKIVRNVFMHNLITIDELTAIIHLFRISRAITAINF